MSRARFRTFAWATLAVTIAVILWGAYVRASGSGAGCGSHWPTCNGEVIPRAASVATLIEFTHRATSGLVGLMALVELAWAFAAFPKRHPARGGAAAAMFFMVTEGLVGRALVRFKYVADDRSVERAVWMSLHLVNTLFLVASLACAAWWASGVAAPRLRRQGGVVALLGVGIVGLFAVGVSGAIAALGDTLFAATSLARGLADDLSPAAHFLQQLRVLHPISAVLVAVYVLYARRAVEARRADASPWVPRLSRALAALVIGQLALGVVNFLLLAPVWMQMVHLLVADLVWIVFVLFGASALSAEESAPALSTAADAELGHAGGA